MSLNWLSKLGDKRKIPLSKMDLHLQNCPINEARKIVLCVAEANGWNLLHALKANRIEKFKLPKTKR